MRFCGKITGKDGLLKRSGSLSQLCDIKISELRGGKEQGVRIADVRTGSGLDFTVVIDRCMDIGFASFNGKALSWMSPTGYVHPSYYEPKGLGWLSGFFGGLLTTCGLTYLGSPCTDMGEELGLHGKIAYQPAGGLSARKYFKGGECFMELSGEMRETAALGTNVRLSRKITAKLGEKKLVINDTVENLGPQETPHMILYHFNFGYPLLDKDTVLLSPAKKVLPRDDDAKKGIRDFSRFSVPQENFREQVFYHEMGAGAKNVTVKLINKRLKFGMVLKYNREQLPRFVQWKHMQAGIYACGLEPANCWVGGRDKERQRGTLQFLKPGEKRMYDLEAEVI